MQFSLDVVDLLQLQEIWSRRPIVTAFTRLESRPTLHPSTEDFKIDDLLPRLARLKRSRVWLSRRGPNLVDDPALVPLGELSEDCLMEMYPEANSPAEKRSSLFVAAYNCYLIAHYKQSVIHTAAALQFLARARHFDPVNRLNASHLPEQDSPVWIPLNITDEIRSLDDRYNPAEPGAPATYVVAEDFWSLLLKAVPEDVDLAAQLALEASDQSFCQALRGVWDELTTLAHTWYRSPSVVGLAYQQKE